jgi:hypothetical protein
VRRLLGVHGRNRRRGAKYFECKKDASRGEVEMAVAQPKSIITNDDGSASATCEYTVGNEPSAGRAVGHAVLDVVTLEIWEVVGTPVEAMNQGQKIQVYVRYDQNEDVTQVQSSKKS